MNLNDISTQISNTIFEEIKPQSVLNLTEEVEEVLETLQPASPPPATLISSYEELNQRLLENVKNNSSQYIPLAYRPSFTPRAYYCSDYRVNTPSSRASDGSLVDSEYNGDVSPSLSQDTISEGDNSFNELPDPFAAREARNDRLLAEMRDRETSTERNEAEIQEQFARSFPLSRDDKIRVHLMHKLNFMYGAIAKELGCTYRYEVDLKLSLLIDPVI